VTISWFPGFRLNPTFAADSAVGGFNFQNFSYGGGVVNAKLLPNLLSGTRIALMPGVFMSALLGSRPWFVGLVAVSLLTDALDGFFARRWNAYSEFGRKLDSAADYVTLMTGAAGIALLWPDIMHREIRWVLAGMAAFFGVLVFGFARFGRPLGYHTWATKVLALLMAASLIPLLADWTARPFHILVGLQFFASAEQIVIALLLPQYRGEMPTVWHALQKRRDAALVAANRDEVGSVSGGKPD
jgi:phosphatidylglycerophosphate synthase